MLENLISTFPSDMRRSSITHVLTRQHRPELVSACPTRQGPCWAGGHSPHRSPLLRARPAAHHHGQSLRASALVASGSDLVLMSKLPSPSPLPTDHTPGHTPCTVASSGPLLHPLPCFLPSCGSRITTLGASHCFTETDMFGSELRALKSCSLT